MYIQNTIGHIIPPTIRPLNIIVLLNLHTPHNDTCCWVNGKCHLTQNKIKRTLNQYGKYHMKYLCGQPLSCIWSLHIMLCVSAYKLRPARISMSIRYCAALFLFKYYCRLVFSSELSFETYDSILKSYKKIKFVFKGVAVCFFFFISKRRVNILACVHVWGRRWPLFFGTRQCLNKFNICTPIERSENLQKRNVSTKEELCLVHDAWHILKIPYAYNKKRITKSRNIFVWIFVVVFFHLFSLPDWFKQNK